MQNDLLATRRFKFIDLSVPNVVKGGGRWMGYTPTPPTESGGIRGNSEISNLKPSRTNSVGSNLSNKYANLFIIIIF